MAGKGTVYHEKENKWLNILYYVAVVCLILVIVLMYKDWQGRKAEYTRLVQEASAQDQNINIELRKTFTEDSEDMIDTGN